MAHTVVLKTEREPVAGDLPWEVFILILPIVGWLQFYLAVPVGELVHWLVAGPLFLAGALLLLFFFLKDE